MAALRAEEFGAHEPGDEVEIHYTRDGATKTVTVTLGDRTAVSQ